MSEELILVETSGPVARLTIQRPKALNAINRAVLLELERALTSVAESARVVVLTGSGEKAFVAGADIGEMAAFSATEARAFSALGHRVLRRLEELEAVTIAEVNGFALGGGCELMLACDFAIASENARLGQPEVKLGVTAGFGGTTRLLRRIGRARAVQLLVTGEQIDAAEAARIGLVNEVVPREHLRPRVDAIAKAVVANGPLAVSATKRAVRLAAEIDLATANAYEQEIFGMCFATDDQKEGMKAFLEKRPASWTAK
ncbi:MAG: enoyl-CoA hydratase/isomerase family protein [Deltaproteobacteria bacterium]|nr:enoyl-CoA hydratase/isomerase family protein [Deltaproteobacteria bacterium]